MAYELIFFKPELLCHQESSKVGLHTVQLHTFLSRG